MSGRWWRAYSRARHDPKLLKLSDKDFRWWFNLVCVASENGGRLPFLRNLAAEFRTTEHAIAVAVERLRLSGLFEIEGEPGPDVVYVAHNWNALQYVSDSSSNRVKQFRERHRNVSVTPSESEAETDTEAETEKRERSASAPRPPKATKSGTRIPSDWRPNDAGRAYAAERGLDPDSTADAFTDWWSAANGPNAIKRDWDAAFRTWCRRDSSRPLVQAANRPVQSTTGHGAYLEQLAAIASRDDADEFDRR